ncbi:MAG: alpha/beta fold hydrolase [Acidiphilium sp.]|nr:alpha/beta fold hydrolase [Acidiphilium sp.]
MRLHATLTGTATHTSDGERPDIVLLHGLFGAGRNLGVIARGLGATHRVLALDARNHGDSPHAPDMRYTTMAADVAETMTAHGIRRAAVIGHSMGGKTAMTLALTAPDRVARLAVLDIAPVAYPEHYLDHIDAMRRLKLTPDLTRAAADAALAVAVPDAALRGFFLHNLVLGATPHWRLDLDAIASALPDLVGWTDPAPAVTYRGPTLFIGGATSSYLPAAYHEAVRARFPQAAIDTIAGTGHWLHAEKPGEVIAHLVKFLA